MKRLVSVALPILAAATALSATGCGEYVAAKEVVPSWKEATAKAAGGDAANVTCTGDNSGEAASQYTGNETYDFRLDDDRMTEKGVDCSITVGAETKKYNLKFDKMVDGKPTWKVTGA